MITNEQRFQQKLIISWVIFILLKRDLEKAKEYYGNVSKESNRLYLIFSKSRVLAITTYQNTLKEIETPFNGF